MTHMPVATLRVWEQRYQAVQPVTAPSGHRLYSPADVQRVVLLRQLTQLGHAIGSIARLDAGQLQQLALAADGEAAATGTGATRAAAALRLVVVGPALAMRLQRSTVARQLRRPSRVVAAFDSLAEAAGAAPGTRADLLLWHAPELQSGMPPELQAAQAACRAQRSAVIYRFAASSATKALADAGIAACREPVDDRALGVWLAELEAGLKTGPAKRQAPSVPRELRGLKAGAAAPRRFDDATLTAIAGLSPTLACECPRHVAELLMQLLSFETYSAGCAKASPADAQLHAYLQQVAGVSRALFESALEHVARHEGLPLR